jgi:hypothetical protein
VVIIELQEVILKKKTDRGSASLTQENSEGNHYTGRIGTTSKTD